MLRETQGKPPYDAEMLLFTLLCCCHGRVTEIGRRAGRRVTVVEGNTPLTLSDPIRSECINLSCLAQLVVAKGVTSIYVSGAGGITLLTLSGACKENLCLALPRV